MFSPEEIREQLKDRNLVTVADASHVHYNTIRSFVKEDSRPSFETVKKLSLYLESRGYCGDCPK